jgi:HEAT repeat protein
MAHGSVRLAVAAAVFAAFSVSMPLAAAEDDKISSLIEKLDPDNSFKVRMQAAILLGRIGDRKAVKPLLDCLKDGDYAIRGSAAIALGNIGDPSAGPHLIALLKDNEELVRREAGNALIKLAGHPEVLQSILSGFQGSDFKIRIEIINVLGNIRDEEAMTALANALGEEVGKLGESAAQVVVGMGKEKGAKVLLTAIKGNNGAARLKAIEIMGQLKDAAFVEPLADVLTADVSGDEAKAAREALRKMRQFIKSDKLAGAAVKGDKAGRDRAIQLLGISGDETAIRTLMDVLSDDDVFFRGRAAQALAVAGDKRAIPKLERLLKDKANARIQGILKNSLKILELSE